MRRLPKPVAGRDLRALPLSPLEAFVFSRIDGASDSGQLAVATGLSDSDVKAALDRLFQLGAIEFSATAPNPPDTPGLQSTRSGEAAGFDPGELEEDVELEPDRKRAVLTLYYKLDRVSHYDILGLPRSADRKAIKRAYYELAPLYHPDSYFRKRLGSFKSKIETIFTRLTLAHDVLTHRDKRAEYDQLLEPGDTGSAVDNAVSSSITMAEEPAAEPRRAQAPAAPAHDAGKAAEVERIRRQALARKLATGARLPAGPASRPDSLSGERAAGGAPAQAGALGGAGAETGTSLREGAENEVQKWLKAAAHSEQQGDFVAAAEAMRNAVALAPERDDLRKRWQNTHEQAQGVLAERYLKQAALNAEKGNWSEAAWNYAKAASMLPSDAAMHERVAFATLACGGSPQRAVEYAQRAVELSPKQGAFRITLARAYLADGALGLAKDETHEALAAAPGDTLVESSAGQIMLAIEQQENALAASGKSEEKPTFGFSKRRGS